jgi:RNA polymerase sigma factor (sigma-70 family)
MERTTDEIVRMVAGSYAKKFNYIDKNDLAQEIHLRILHGMATSYDPSRGSAEKYIRAIANRTAYAYAYTQRHVVHGRMADLEKWKNVHTIPIEKPAEDEDSTRHRIHEPVSPEPTVDLTMWSNDIVECIQQIFEQHVEDGKLARGMLLEHRSAEEIADEYNVPSWRVYRATFRIRRAIKMDPRARLLWETK